jgi:hypothetical protein
VAGGSGNVIAQAVVVAAGASLLDILTAVSAVVAVFVGLWATLVSRRAAQGAVDAVIATQELLQLERLRRNDEEEFRVFGQARAVSIALSPRRCESAVHLYGTILNGGAGPLNALSAIFSVGGVERDVEHLGVLAAGVALDVDAGPLPQPDDGAPSNELDGINGWVRFLDTRGKWWVVDARAELREVGVDDAWGPLADS